MSLQNDGRLAKLKKRAKNEREWSVHTDYLGKPWNYFAVESRKELKDDCRLLKFPESNYIVISDTAAKGKIFEHLSHQAFRKILPKVMDYTYLGGPHLAYRQERPDGSYYGEIWLPVIKK